VIPGSPLADDCAFEDLNSFLVAFFDFDVHTHGVSGPERGQVFLHLQLFNLFKRVHNFCSPKLEMRRVIQQPVARISPERDPRFVEACLAQAH
jgi:hypothetical protein